MEPGLMAFLTRALGTIAAGMAAPALAVSFTAGQWDHHTRLVSAEIPGIPQWVVRLLAGNGRRTSCHSAEQLRARPEALLTADERAVCRLRDFSMADGKLVFDTFCTNGRFPEGLLVSSRGSYTATSYSIETITTGTKGGRPVRIETTGTGRLVGGTCRRP